jgi:hypothetical protein
MATLASPIGQPRATSSRDFPGSTAVTLVLSLITSGQAPTE